MWNKFKSLFTTPTDAELVVETSGEARRGDYAVRRSRKFDMLARILAVVAAFLLWFYVVSTTTTSEERTFELIPVVCRNDTSLRAEHGLIVQSISIDTLNITLMGSRQSVRALTADQVKAYVNLSEISTAGEHPLNVYVEVPSGITLVSQTVKQILVNVDSPTSRVMDLSVEDLQLRGWSLADGCYFGKKELSINQLTLEGPTLALNKVAGVELRSDIIGSAQGDFTVTATPYLVDAEGNEITDSSITVREKNSVEVRVEVLKSKEVPLTVQSKHGTFSDDLLTVTPSTVTITGDPQAVDDLRSISLGEVDERTLLTDTTLSFAVVADGLSVSDQNGKPITEASVKIKVSALPIRVIEMVNVWRGDEIVGTVSVKVRAVSEEHSAQLQALIADNMVIYADPKQPEGEISAMTVVFSEFFRDAVYEIEIAGYQPLPSQIESDMPEAEIDPPQTELLQND